MAAADPASYSADLGSYHADPALYPADPGLRDAIFCDAISRDNSM